MCMMCEQEALYDAYLEYVARKQAEAAANGTVFKSEAVDDPADAPAGLTPGHDTSAVPPKEN